MRNFKDLLRVCHGNSRNFIIFKALLEVQFDIKARMLKSFNKRIYLFLGRLGGVSSSSREEDLKHYEDRIQSLKKELEAEKEKNEDLKKTFGDTKPAKFDELRSAQTEKHRLQKEVIFYFGNHQVKH